MNLFEKIGSIFKKYKREIIQGLIIGFILIAIFFCAVKINSYIQSQKYPEPTNQELAEELDQGIKDNWTNKNGG